MRKIFRREFEGRLLKEGHEEAAQKKLELLGAFEECTLHDIGSAATKLVLFH